jgi:ATP-dependent protease HslVU (ClpYQ) ATPase subunit
MSLLVKRRSKKSQGVSSLNCELIFIVAEDLNMSLENIGARRLHALLEKLIEDISFEGPDAEQKEYLT